MPGSPDFPARRRPVALFGVLKIFLGQVLLQAQVPIFIVLELVANKDLVVSRVCVHVIGFPVSPDYRYLIWLQCHKVLLLLRSLCYDGAEACVREQVLCLCRMSAANKKG